MSDNILPDMLGILLSAIEEKESKFLFWGDTNGFLSDEDLISLIDKILDDEASDLEEDADDLKDELLERAMIFGVVELGTVVGYKSRMACSVHLYRNLRQWFHGNKIEESKTLISDFRFARKARSYPVRDVQTAKLIQEWHQTGLIDQVKSHVLKALMGDFELSGFQARATADILKRVPLSRRYNPTATIIAAGTGSGKTNAFYWPALAYIVSDIVLAPETRARTLAIYPRTELLKDQFNEAWRQCRQLDKFAIDHDTRVIRIGALYSGTIKTVKAAQITGKAYHSFALLKCVTERCRGEMRWNKQDVDLGLERLICSECQSEVGDNQVTLTRESMKKSPPDILFTTTEMLNQKMADPYYRHLFGFRSQNPIPLILLDEVHTYSGTSGANVAFLLRRWRALAKMAPHYVGLSATLSDAEVFFSRLTGAKEYNTHLVEPMSSEMIEEGSEYLLALRGDAVSQTALLSTTIQAAMLSARMQDPLINPKSDGTWGSKTFIFTDDLDATNRLHYQLSDAEGWVIEKGRWKPKSNTSSLATLRNPDLLGENRSKLTRYGQDWSIANDIGHELDSSDRPRISRTSSQDSGVDENAPVIVATATLEVGFNDPQVGTIIQHKAPRNIASYLQRKGRAGRGRKMRPWTIITLSEFGKDRTAFQNYERLLDPEIEGLTLPIENDHIKRMQAAMATLEWVASKTNCFNPWKDLNYPDRISEKLKKKLLELLHEILDEEQKRAELELYISRALSVDQKTVESIVWKAPRSIYNEVLPTLIRKLESNWGSWDSTLGKITPGAEKNTTWGSPLAQFIPPQLFSGLNSPDLEIVLERHVSNEYQSMPFFSGLREFAPGRITKRYSVGRGDYSDWVFPADIKPSPELHGSELGLELVDVFGDGHILIENVYCSEFDDFIEIFRPGKIIAKSLPPQMTMTEKSNASLRWYSQFKAIHETESHRIPEESHWDTDLFQSISFYSHQSMTPLDILRFTTGSDATLNFKSGDHADLRLNWKNNGCPVGIGTTLSVDALCMKFQCSEQDIRTKILDQKLIGSLRYSYLKHMLEQCVIFGGNKFHANWVHECFIAAIALEVKRADVGTIDAIAAVCSNQLKLNEIKNILFKDDFEIVEAEEEQSFEQQKDQKLQVYLSKLFENKELLTILHTYGVGLFEPLEQNKDFLKWCRDVLANTLAAAAKQMVCIVLPNASDQSFSAESQLEGNSIIVWLCENEAGGGGIITELEDKYLEDSLGVLNTFAGMFQVGTYEQLDADLKGVLKSSADGTGIDLAFGEMRASIDYTTRLKALNKLRLAVVKAGFEFSHSFSAVLFSRILRLGSNKNTDSTLLTHISHWKELETEIGFELPINIAAAVLAATEKQQANIFQRACEIQSVLWPRGSDVRQEALPFYNQFYSGNNLTERLLVAKICQDNTIEIDYESENWQIMICEVVSKDGSVDLMVKRESIHQISKIVTRINVTSVDIFGLLLYPRIAVIKREFDNIRLRIELSEVVH